MLNLLLVKISLKLFEFPIPEKIRYSLERSNYGTPILAFQRNMNSDESNQRAHSQRRTDSCSVAGSRASGGKFRRASCSVAASRKISPSMSTGRAAQ